MKFSVPFVPAFDRALHEHWRLHHLFIVGPSPLAELALHILQTHGVDATILEIPSSASLESLRRRSRKAFGRTDMRFYPFADILLCTEDQAMRSCLLQYGRRVFDGGPLFADCVYDLSAVDAPAAHIHYALDEYMFRYCSTHYPELLLVPSIDVVVTERCTLRCQNCSNLMPLYSHPRDFAPVSLEDPLLTLADAVDHVFEYRVLGGEPLLSGTIEEHVQQLRRCSNYSRIAILTNGSLVPSDQVLSSLVGRDTYFHVSDYGDLSVATQRLASALDRLGGCYDIDRMPGWHDCAIVKIRKRTPAQLARVFEGCCMRHGFTVLRSRLYQCPFAAHGANLKLIPHVFQDSCDLRNRMHVDAVKTRIRRMISRSQPPKACEYCAGRAFGDFSLPVAVQCARKTHIPQSTPD